MRTTENLSLRLDPEVVRLARRTAEERRQTLREFFEAALRSHVAALTRPEEQANLLSNVEEAFLARMDKRLHDVLERVAALSAKEATDQAQTLQIAKRLLFLEVSDKQKAQAAINQSWNEAVERVRSRGRPYPPEAVKELEDKLAAAEKLSDERAEKLAQAIGEAQQARQEANRIKAEAQNSGGAEERLKRRIKELEGFLEREMWVSAQLESQSGLQLKRKTAAELRLEHFRRQQEVDG